MFLTEFTMKTQTAYSAEPSEQKYYPSRCNKPANDYLDKTRRESLKT